MSEWRQIDVFKLIEAYREQRLLWDPLLDDFKNRNKKHDAWLKLDQTFGVEVGDCERKMRKLIGQFSRESKKVLCTGKGAKGNKWIFFNHLLFLNDKNQPRDNVDAGIEQVQEEKEPENVENAYDQYSTQISEDNEHLNDSLGENLETSGLEPIRKRQSARARAVSKRSKPMSRDDEAYAIMKIILNKKQDGFDCFGSSVAVTLKGLDPVSASYAKFEINKILFKAEMGMYANGNQSGNTTPDNRTPSLSESFLTLNHDQECSHPSTSRDVTTELDNTADVSQVITLFNL